MDCVILKMGNTRNGGCRHEKYIMLILAGLLLLSVCGCGNESSERSRMPDAKVSYVENNGKTYLVLPTTKWEVLVEDAYIPYLKNVDPELLAEAEKTVVDTPSMDELNGRHFDLELREGTLYLCIEIIVPIDPPILDEEGGQIFGCGYDHDHKFLDLPISK